MAPPTSNFNYGMHFYMTLLHQADTKELARLGVTAKERNILFNKEYVLEQVADNPRFLAQYTWHESVIGSNVNLKERYQYTPRLEKEHWTLSVRKAAHETNHSLRQQQFGVAAREKRKKYAHVAGALGGLGAGYVFIDTKDFEWEQLLSLPIAYLPVRFGAPPLVKNHLKYVDELKAHKHEENVGLILEPTTKTVAQIQKEKEAIKNGRTIFGKAKEHFFTAYPSKEKVDLIRLEAQEKTLLKGSTALYDPARIERLREMTKKNIDTKKFAIRDLG